jgi:pimeloyl-ACP methyl ester carboxylesterase
MPFSECTGLRIHYEVRGVGAPLLLLNHIGASQLGWRDEFLAALEEHFTLILPDYRGTGHSDKPDVPYTLRDLAQDTVGILDTLRQQRVHLLGLSMGGAVAQELVLLAPERVDHLVLVGTFCGPRKSVPPDPAVRQRFAQRAGLPRQEQIKVVLPVYYSQAFIDSHEALLVALTARGTQETPPHTLVRQTEAVQQFDSYDRLAAIHQPTLVIHGTADPIIPCANAHILAERLPYARVVLIPGVGHVPMTEQPDCVAHLVQEFCLFGAS